MAFELESGLIFNSIFWLTAPRPSELGMVEGMMDDVSVICQAKGIPFQKYVVPSGDDLIRALAEIEAAARNGLKPLIYLDMHGSAIDGVEIAATNEMVSWERVVDSLRAINRETGNNLLVVAGVCYGFFAIRESMITDHAPFYMLIAPDQKITFGELIDQTFPFFQDLTTNLDVVQAAKNQLSPKMQLAAVGTLMTASPVGGPSYQSVRSGSHAAAMALSLLGAIRASSKGGPRRVHLFIAGPNAFAFFLGQSQAAIGPVSIYEWDFDGLRDGDYSVGLELP